MQNTKLIQLLKTLTELELKQLGQFLKSPFHNSNKRVLALFNLIKPYHTRNYESNRLQKEILFYKIFPPNTHYEASNMRALMSYLTQRIEDFLIEKEIKKDKPLRQGLLARAYSNKNLYKQFEKTNRQQNVILAKLEVQDMEAHQQQFNNNWVYYFHANTQKYHTKIPSLEQAMFHLDQFYLQAKFRLGLEMENRIQILQEEYDILFWEELKKVVKQNKELQSPLYQLHILCQQLQKKFNSNLYERAFQLYTKHIESFGNWEQKAFLELLLNLGARQTYNGNSQYFNKIHQLHLIGLEKNLVINDQQIEFSSFFNISGTAFFIGKFDWSENFIKNYQKYIPSLLRRDLINLVGAYKHYYKGNKEEKKHFELALEKLRIINNNSLRFILIPKNRTSG